MAYIPVVHMKTHFPAYKPIPGTPHGAAPITGITTLGSMPTSNSPNGLNPGCIIVGMHTYISTVLPISAYIPGTYYAPGNFQFGFHLAHLRILGPHHRRVLVQRLDLDGLLSAVVSIVQLLVDSCQVQLTVKLLRLPPARQTCFDFSFLRVRTPVGRLFSYSSCSTEFVGIILVCDCRVFSAAF